jgi:hypothetical protein
MKKWQWATAAAVIAAAAVGAAGASFAGTQTQPNSRIVVPPVSGIISPNEGWRPANAPAKPPTIPSAPGLPAATGTVLFSSDFGAGNTNNWHATILPSSDSPASWLVKDGSVEQAGDANGMEQTDEAYLLAGDAAWQNVTLEANVLGHSGEGVGLIWNASGTSFYRVQLFWAQPNSAPKAVLELVENGVAKPLATAPASVYAGYTLNQWATVRVSSTNGHQQVWVDGVQIFDVANSALTSGQVGLFAYADSHSRFDNVRVSTGR